MTNVPLILRAIRILLLPTLSIFFLTGCDFRSPQDCSLVYQDRPDLLSNFAIDQNGLANKAGSSLSWSRCPAGMQLSNPKNCSGTPLFLTFDQAQTYAIEISEKSAQKIRLPTRREMSSITESNCINPSLNTNVFPIPTIDKFWTSEQNLLRNNLACTVYTYQGRATCNESKIIERPFMLVIERARF
tara:strand:- start:199 stop:759 length:561 start_codon:yes stop_codon:yes gene_type:complete